MKKIILLSLLAITVIGCSPSHEYDTVRKVHYNRVDNDGKYCIHLQKGGCFHTDKLFTVGDTIEFRKKDGQK